MLISRAIDLVKDFKRIADIPAANGPSHAELRRAYLRLQGLAREPGIVSICDYKVGYLDGSSMLQLFREIFVNRLYDLPITSQKPRIIDCGSNIGMSILFFKQNYPEAVITGFEPHPLVFDMLSENVNRNNLADVTVHRMALGETKGATEFYVDQKQPGALNMSIFQGTGQSPIIVPVGQLSTYIEGEVDLLKLDIEGAEEMVLRELADHGKLQEIAQIACEYHHHRDRNIDSLSKTLAILEEAGFGYHLDAYRPIYPTKPRYQQDVIIHAYRKLAR